MSKFFFAFASFFSFRMAPFYILLWVLASPALPPRDYPPDSSLILFRSFSLANILEGSTGRGVCLGLGMGSLGTYIGSVLIRKSEAAISGCVIRANMEARLKNNGKRA